MFEHSLFDLETADLEKKTQPRRRRWLTLPLAVGVHLVALTGFALASYWNVGAVADPDLNMAAFVVMLPPPAIQLGGGPQPHPVTAPPQPTPTPAPTTIHQPDPTILSERPADAPSPAPSPDPGPVLTDDPTVPPGPGDPHGDRNSHNPVGPIFGGPAPVGDSLPTYLTAEMSRPVPLHPILPRYTEPARRAGLQGTVVVEATIDEQGRATDVRILRGLPMGLDRAAVEAIQQVTFKPAMIGNRPVKVFFTLTVNFAIQR